MIAGQTCCSSARSLTSDCEPNQSAKKKKRVINANPVPPSQRYPTIPRAIMATKLASTPPSHPSTSSLSSPSASPRSQQEQRRLTWKVDLLLLPLLTLCYGLQFWDKAVLGSATLFGILPALDLQTTSTTGVASLARYSLASSAFYYGYMAVSMLSCIAISEV